MINTWGRNDPSYWLTPQTHTHTPLPHLSLPFSHKFFDSCLQSSLVSSPLIHSLFSHSIFTLSPFTLPAVSTLSFCYTSPHPPFLLPPLPFPPYLSPLLLLLLLLYHTYLGFPPISLKQISSHSHISFPSFTIFSISFLSCSSSYPNHLPALPCSSPSILPSFSLLSFFLFLPFPRIFFIFSCSYFHLQFFCQSSSTFRSLISLTNSFLPLSF